MSRREKLFWLCAGTAFIVLVASLIPSHYPICEVAEKTKEEHCPSYQFVPFVGIKIAQILDKMGGVITALATIAIAIFTFTLKRATDKLWDAGEKQLELLGETSAAQSRDMQASIVEAKRAAEAAEKSLVAANRAWIKVDIRVGGPIHYDSNGANFKLIYVLENIGKSPAVNVDVRPRVVESIIHARIELLKDIARWKEMAPLLPGNVLFPGEKIEPPITVCMSQDQIKEATKLLPAIYPVIIGSVTYRMGLDDVCHQTGFAIQIRRDSAPRPFTTERNYLPAVIWPEEGDVPAEDVRLVRSILDGGYAD